jgi:hypothetical protein
MFKFNRKNLILVLIERFSVVLRHANHCLKKLLNLFCFRCFKSSGKLIIVG